MTDPARAGRVWLPIDQHDHPPLEDLMMNNNIRITRRPRRAWSRAARSAAAIIAAAGLALLAGCGGSPSATGTGGSSNAAGSTSAQSASSQPLAFSRCVRSHGVPNFPDPSSNGQIPKKTPQQLGVSSSQFQAAQSACASLLPNGGQTTQAALQQSWSDMANFARCMRSHGVPNWPDPTRYPQHPERPYFNLPATGIDPNAPQVTAKIHTCLYLLHGENPQHLGGS
jgi:hypothetical protein